MPDFVRFQAKQPRPSGRYPGVLALANTLAKEGRLLPAQWALWRGTLDWLNATYPDPWSAMPSLGDRTKYPHTFCWFKASATDALERMPAFLTLLDAHGIEWVELRTADPGIVVYEDEVQVVVAPLVPTGPSGRPSVAARFEMIHLRPTTPSDRDFVSHVSEDAMRPYVEQLFGAWNDGEQRRRSEASCDDADCRIIMIGTVAIGVLLVTESQSEVFLAKIYLLTEYRNSGIRGRSG